jgi:4-amino-4-deoxy-L-arabinose transferase-like glycosyltransferase
LVAIACGAAALLWTLALATTAAGWSVRLWGLRISSRDPFRSLVLGALLTSIGLAGLRIPGPGKRALTALAAAAAILATTLGLLLGSVVASGADGYGYVSQADLWTKGSLVSAVPLSAEATWADASWAMTPLGYRPARAEGLMVPVYPPGFPLGLAAMKLLFGEPGMRLVVPLLGGLLVWLTFVLGRSMDGAGAGLLAAMALVASPAFLFHLVLPMSDVPAAAWWLLAVILALKPDVRWRLALSGCAAALALLTRPNLVLLALPVGVLVLRGSRSRTDRFMRVMLWGSPAAAAVLTIAALNAAWYGSPLQPGYGRLDILYSPRYTWQNIAQFTAWMLTTQTPFILLAVFATTWLARWSLSFSLAVLLSYVWYLPGDNWTFLRFLLPAYPMLLAAAAAVAVGVVRNHRWPNGLVAAIGVLVVCAGLWQGRAAFAIAASEERYRAAAEAVAQTAPANAVIIANLHSGSVRYYANRVTLRFEWLGEDEYNPALTTLRQHGHPIYALLDGEEVMTFKNRYGRVTDLTWMMRPTAVVGDRVFFYAVN